MRIVIVGATGNVGTSLLEALRHDGGATSVLGLARRPKAEPGGSGLVEWKQADITTDDLVPHFRGADAVVHLAWAIQPSRDEGLLWRINAHGTARVAEAVAEARVPAFLYASSVGAYSPGPKDRLVDESWPTHGVPSSWYSRHKAYTERLLDGFELEHPDVRVVRIRPALIFKRSAASEIRRLFAGPFLPTPLLRRALIPVVPDTPGLRFQTVHSRDVASAFRLAALSDVRGAFNLAADPVLDPAELARVLGARPVPVPARVLKAGAAVSWHLRLQPSSPGWIDLALQSPLLDAGRARRDLGWAPTRSSGDALLELLEGMADGAGGDTPTLDAKTGGPARVGEVATGVGARQ